MNKSKVKVNENTRQQRLTDGGVSTTIIARPGDETDISKATLDALK